MAILIVLTITLNITNNVKTVATIANFNNLIQDLDFAIGGEVAGIKILANGVLVIGVDDVRSGIKEGDIILSLDGVDIESNADIVEYINIKNIIISIKIFIFRFIIIFNLSLLFRFL